MKSKGKYIGVESRIQYEILEAAVHDYLSNGALDKEKCLSHIKQFTKGENRAGKILKHINVLIAKNEAILSKLSKHIEAATFSQLSPVDRKAMLLCLFCNSFPITYDILIGFAQAFKVQPIVSKEVITHKIGSAYGSNRAMHIAVSEIIPFLIEIGILKRDKIGVYSSNSPLTINDNVVKELIIFTDIVLSSSKVGVLKEMNYRPWFYYFKFELNFNFGKLIKLKNGILGTEYLTLNLK
jgi:hypothetical protein